LASTFAKRKKKSGASHPKSGPPGGQHNSVRDAASIRAAALCLPELLCPPPRDHTLRSEYSMDALNPGLLCPPDTREAPARRLRRPTFHFPHDFALDFSSHAPQSYLFPFSSAVGSAEGTEELTSCYGTNCDFRDGKEDRQGEEWVTWRSESPEWPWSA
jgi:hypothetical protein